MKFVRPLFWLLIGVALSLALIGTARAEAGDGFPWVITFDFLEWDFISAKEIPFSGGSGNYMVRIYEKLDGSAKDRFVSYTLAKEPDFPPRFGIWTKIGTSGEKTAFYMQAPDEWARLLEDVPEDGGVSTLIEMNTTGKYMPQGLFGQLFEGFLRIGKLPEVGESELAHHYFILR